MRFIGKMAMLGVACISLTACEQVQKVAADVAGLPTDENVLFWTQDQRDNAFRQMEVLTTTRTIEAGDTIRELPAGKPLPASLPAADGSDISVDDYMADQRLAGLVVLQDGKVRLEEYRLDFTKDDRWTSFSVAKSLVSTLVGAAIKDGYIKSLDDPLTSYIPELKGSGYDGVTVEQLLTMTSGVKWNEDYEDKDSDVARFNTTKSKDGVDPVILYMKTLVNEAEPGTRWQYNTGETNLIGVLVAKATGKSLSEYLSEKVWEPYGMAQDAVWILNDGGKEIGGCCISATTRDFALFGQFAMNGGKVGDTAVVPDGWYEKAGTKQADIGMDGRGYGYQWWTYDDGSFAAQGIFGQGIFIDPKRKLVIAGNGNWPRATPDDKKAGRDAFYRAVQAYLDSEAAPAK
ncbi:serine hydrolase domain-containing protein [Sphingorhabdus sp. M41]|uniref:serine hydrolase domain-containing protein n=1 Tax=Sphingorhabdus sp. M41 TaxID=1806885 RepID=UPI00078B36BA|nr:serine hydrolase [Sphingorhabdus sp. M41]AMO71403.1 serine hydrolase [Sphingorhabdus sp. M41]